MEGGSWGCLDSSRLAVREVFDNLSEAKVGHPAVAPALRYRPSPQLAGYREPAQENLRHTRTP